MANSRRQLKAVILTAICVTAALVLVGIAMTVYAVIGLERGSAPFTATLGWGRACLIGGVVVGLGAFILRRVWSRRITPPGGAQM